MCSNFEFLALRLKKKDVESKIGGKVIKPILRMWGIDPPSSKNDTDLDFYMRDHLKLMFDKFQEDCGGPNGALKLSLDKHEFID